MANKAAYVFRVAAIAEAFSWTGLLIGMFFKYVVKAGDGGVPIFGWAHGALFVVYLLAALVAGKMLGWRLRIVLLALVASIPPLFTWLFENWARRKGKLDGPNRLDHGGTGLFVKSYAS